jgi:hypothetical protein
MNVKISSFSIHSGRFRRLIAINGSGYSGDNPFTFFVNDTGQLGYIFGNGTTNLEQVNTISGGPTLEINKWYHVTLSFNGTQKKLYVGGNLVATVTNSTTFTNPLNNKLILGSYNGSIGCMQGSIGTVHVYNRALSDAEVLSNYSIYSQRYASGLVTSGLILYVDPNNPLSYSGGTKVYNLVNPQYTGDMFNGPTLNTDFTGGYFATDGTNDYIRFPLTRSTVPYTVFVFSRILSSGRMIGDNSNWLMGQFQSQINAYHANSWVWGGGGPSGTGWRSHCVTGDYANDSWKAYANGLKLVENDGGSSGFNLITLGGMAFGDQPCQANFGVFLVYDRVLTDAEVLQNHDNFRGRYGI